MEVFSSCDILVHYQKGYGWKTVLQVVKDILTAHFVFLA